MNHKKIAKPKKYRQNNDVTEHFHPRQLARAIARNQMQSEGYEQMNKPVRVGKEPTMRSKFSRMWRSAAAYAVGHHLSVMKVKGKKQVVRRMIRKAGANP